MLCADRLSLDLYVNLLPVVVFIPLIRMLLIACVRNYRCSIMDERQSWRRVAIATINNHHLALISDASHTIHCILYIKKLKYYT